ncbi:unnamed protein product [Arabidopsis halleri]
MAEHADDLVKLLFLDSVLSRRTEKEWAKKCVATTSDDHCQHISYLAKHVHVPKNIFFQPSKTQMLEGCLHSANKWLDCSDDPVKGDTMISYCDLRNQVELISSSPAFMESEGFEPDYSNCNIGVWWDLRSCPLPNSASYSGFRVKVITVLEALGFCGPVDFSAVCDPFKLDADLIP